MEVVVIGNCQSEIIARMIKETCPTWIVNHWIVFVPELKNKLDVFRASVQRADLIVTHPVHDGYAGVEEFATSWVRGNKANAADLVVVPNLYFEGQHPGQAGFALHDTELLFCGSPYQERLTIYEALKFRERLLTQPMALRQDCYPPLRMVESISAASLAELRRREKVDRIDVAMSDFISENWRSLGLFHTMMHPARVLLKIEIDRVFLLLGMRHRISDLGPDHFDFIHYPAASSISMGLKWESQDSELFRLPLKTYTRTEYWHSYRDFITGIDRADLEAAADKSSDYQNFISSFVLT